jgi:cell division protein FtsQ
MTFPTTLTLRRRRLLRLAVALTLLAALVAGGWLWLRDSSLVRVTHVRIDGVTSSDGDRVRSALDVAARSMTTLHLEQRTLEQAVASFPSVAGVRASTSFPHRITIQVDERQPVAALVGDGGGRVPVAGNGIVLNGVVADRDLPALRLAHPVVGARVTERRALGALQIAAAAPQALLHAADQLTVDSRGVVVDLRNGPPLLFGDGSDAAAKWDAAARVLAEPSAAGATYLDLRVPGRVAAGGLAPVPTATADPNPQLNGSNGQTVNP